MKVDFVTFLWRCIHCRTITSDNPIPSKRAEVEKIPDEYGPHHDEFPNAPEQDIVKYIEAQKVELSKEEYVKLLDKHLKITELRIELQRLHIQLLELEERGRLCFPDFPVKTLHEWEEIGGGIVTTYEEYPICPQCNNPTYVPPSRDERWIEVNQLAHLRSYHREGKVVMSCGLSI